MEESEYTWYSFVLIWVNTVILLSYLHRYDHPVPVSLHRDSCTQEWGHMDWSRSLSSHHLQSHRSGLQREEEGVKERRKEEEGGNEGGGISQYATQNVIHTT